MFILNVRMGAVYFISKSKGAADPKRLTTTGLADYNLKVYLALVYATMQYTIMKL